MRPFLLLSIRAEKAAADDEYDAFCRFLGVGRAGLHRMQLGREPLGAVDLDDWSGILLGGGAFTMSDPVEAKSTTQKRAEVDILGLLDRVVAADFPFLGACYGIGTLGRLRGGVVDRTWSEPIGAVAVTLTEAGLVDPLTADLPGSFDAFLGHKEAVASLPGGAVLLATAPSCPVQAFRIGTRVYATQFHPELDVDALCTRIEVYRHYGYFEPAAAEAVKAAARAATVTEPTRLLARFAELFARD